MKTASLSSSLLVRKGAAAPSGYAPPVATPMNGVAVVKPVLPVINGRRPHGSLREESPQKVSPHVAQKRDCSPRKQTPDHNGRVRLSVRLDQDQHTKLQLAAVHTKRSMRDLIATAVDTYLHEIAPNVRHGACACLARSGGNSQSSN